MYQIGFRMIVILFFQHGFLDVKMLTMAML
jgi:hypothetical protein